MYVRTRFPGIDKSDRLVGGTGISSFSVFATWFVVCTCFAERGMLNFFSGSSQIKLSLWSVILCQEPKQLKFNQLIHANC